MAQITFIFLEMYDEKLLVSSMEESLMSVIRKLGKDNGKDESREIP